MVMQKYSTPIASRNLIRAEMEMLMHAEPIIVLGAFGVQKEQPKRKTDTIVFRRMVPFGGAAKTNPADGYSETPVIVPGDLIVSEGTTPTPNTITYTDVTVTLEQYAVLFRFSSKAEEMYEDDIPGDMAQQTGETMAETTELVAYGVQKAGISVTYANGSTRAGLNTTISLNKLRAIARSMEANRAKHVTSKISAGEKFDTSPVEPAYLVFHHTDVTANARDLEGFTRRVEYGTAVKPAHAREIGACEEFRFITSPLFAPYLAAGASVTGTGMKSVGGSNCDVYPLIVTAKDACGHVSLKGRGHSGVTPTIISSRDKNHANPSGLFGYVGADFWYAPVRLNENFLQRFEVCVTDL